jgi:hypothetical protein
MDPKTLAMRFSGKGWKTYVAGAVFILWGAGGMYLGLHGPDTAIAFAGSGLGLIGIRNKMDDIALPQEVVNKLKEGK